MSAIAMFLAAALLGPIWAYLTGFFGIILLWIMAFMGHFLGFGALFTNFRWWTVLRWGYALSTLEVVLMSAGSQSAGSTVEPGTFRGAGLGLAASFAVIVYLRHRHRQRESALV